nr:MAG TPA: hypothetical protein [Caudoviricetes sp.]
MTGTGAGELVCDPSRPRDRPPPHAEIFSLLIVRSANRLRTSKSLMKSAVRMVRTR